jgi:hypothetical protein
MAMSGTISTTTFNTRRVIDHAFRRCKIPPQQVTAEMQQTAIDLLYLLLSELSSIKTPSWCIDKLILPMYEGQPIVTLPLGTEEVLNLNYRTLLQQVGVETITSTEYEVDFVGEDTIVSNVGLKWLTPSVDVDLEVSEDGAVWVKVGEIPASAGANEWIWHDIIPANAFPYFRVKSVAPMLLETLFLGNTPTEIPFGLLNRDTYVAQSNKVFTGRPTTYWFQRNINQPTLNLWPAPNAYAEYAQLIVWRHRQIMDVGNLQQELDIPQRWYDAIVMKLASKLAMETETVDPNLMIQLMQVAELSMRTAWDGDNDGSPTTIQPWIAPYTR